MHILKQYYNKHLNCILSVNCTFMSCATLAFVYSEIKLYYYVNLVSNIWLIKYNRLITQV